MPYIAMVTHAMANLALVANSEPHSCCTICDMSTHAHM